MKKIFIIWFCISVVMTIVFGFTFMSKPYFERFSQFPDFMEIFANIIKSFSGMTLKFKAIHDVISFFEAVGAIFGFVFSLLTLPFYLIGYIVNVINFLLPFDLTNGGVAV